MHIVRLFPIAVVIAVVGMVQPAAAVLQFYKEFQVMYLDKHADQEFAKLVKKPANRCFLCHHGKKRKNHNSFGEHLEELLDRKKDAKDKKKIQAAIKKVAAMHVDPKNDQSETYAARIAASKWPGGELAELKKEPEGSEDE